MKSSRARIPQSAQERPSRRLLSARSIWPALAVLAACVPFAGGFSLSHIFYIRDLTMFFWPRHLWMHRSLVSGAWPLWDPYAAAGQAVFPDALNQLFLPPALLLRLLPPIPGFNLLVAAPFPLAALGMWLFLRRHVSDASAAFGAIVFAVSGPVVSTANFPNLSWSVAWIPWMLWSADRDRAAVSARGFALMTAMIACQILSGEPVTMAGTLGLLLAYVALVEDAVDVRGLTRRIVRVLAAIVVAAAISAVQLVPMALAAHASPRGLMQTDNFWSVHPLWLAELMLPHVFGDTFHQYNARLPWIAPLNSGRDPFFYSLYVGPIVLLLSVLGAFTGRRRWRFFWLAVAGAGVALAFGDYAPVYPLLQRLVPPVRSFRFPAKFLIFASLGLAALAATAADALQGRAPVSARAVKTTTVAAIAAALGLVILVSLVIVAPFTGARMFYELGVKVRVADPVAGAEFLFNAVPPLATRALLLLIGSALLVYLGWKNTRARRVALALLFGLATIDLISATVGLNPVLPAARLGPPAWTAALAAHPSARFYFGGKFRGSLVQDDIDLQGVQWNAPKGVTVEEGRTLMIAALAMTPAPWGVHELISYDLPLLWPVEDARAVTMFERADRAGRLRFLVRGGVRYCLLPSPPYRGAPPLERVGDQFGAMAVYECAPNARRAYVVGNAAIVPDVTAQLHRLFDASFDAESTVMLERSPANVAAGSTPSADAFARITVDDAREVAIDAAAGPGGGYLVLLDSFAPGWRADVDGRAADLLRANALYRAVYVPPGRHAVTFTYHPTVLYGCAIVSIFAILALTGMALKRRAPR